MRSIESARLCNRLPKLSQAWNLCHTISPEALYNTGFIYIPPIGLHDLLNGWQVEEWKLCLCHLRSSPINTSGFHTASLEGSSVWITTQEAF